MGGKCISVECDTGDVFVYRNSGRDGKIEMFKVPKGSFDKVLHQSYAYLEQLLSGVNPENETVGSLQDRSTVFGDKAAPFGR